MLMSMSFLLSATLSTSMSATVSAAVSVTMSATTMSSRRLGDDNYGEDDDDDDDDAVIQRHIQDRSWPNSACFAQSPFSQESVQGIWCLR